MSYKVMYHAGGEVDLKTKAAVGRLSLEDGRLVILGEPGISIPFAELRSAELFRLHGTGRMLRLEHAGGTLFVSVIRFCLFGYFAVVNFFATGRLRQELEALIRESSQEGSGANRASGMA